MTISKNNHHSDEFPKHSFSKDGILGQALVAASQSPERPFSPNFAKRVAQKARRQAATGKRETILFAVGMSMVLLGLIFCGVIGWRIAQPTGLNRLLDGPFPLILTALVCLILATRFSRSPKPATGS